MRAAKRPLLYRLQCIDSEENELRTEEMCHKKYGINVVVNRFPFLVTCIFPS